MLRRSWRDPRNAWVLPPPTAAAAQASEIAAVAEADGLLDQAQRLRRQALGVLEFAKADGNPGGVLRAIDRL